MGDTERIADYYDNLVAHHGCSPKACDASNQQALEVRYKVLSEACDMAGKSVLEVGCGFGDLGSYLQNKFTIDYTGIDLSYKMIQEGKKRHPQLNLHWCDVNLWGAQRDIVLAQGIFYLTDEATAKNLITQMFRLAREVLAFTAISTWSPVRAGGEYYVDPLTMLGFCKTLTPRVILRHDYHAGDVAFYLYKEDR